MSLKIYDITNDTMKEATQEDVDNLQKAVSGLARKATIISAISNLNIVTDKDKLDKIQTIVWGN